MTSGCGEWNATGWVERSFEGDHHTPSLHTITGRDSNIARPGAEPEIDLRTAGTRARDDLMTGTRSYH